MRIALFQNIIDFIRNKKYAKNTTLHQANLQITDEDLKNIREYLEYKNTRKAKSVIYTCITNNYDDINTIKTYKYINKEWDYICFTDNEEEIKQSQIGIWEIRPLQYTKSDNTRNNRWHKLNPHKLFPNYSESIYIDANINILTPHIFNLIKEKNLPFILPKHYMRNCIYKEYKEVSRLKLDENTLIKKELELIKKSGMPKNYGLCENNILYRKHNLPEIIHINEEWWNMVLNYAKRDQLSLVYLFWKNDIKIKDITFKNTRTDNKNFYVFKHAKGK